MAITMKDIGFVAVLIAVGLISSTATEQATKRLIDKALAGRVRAEVEKILAEKEAAAKQAAREVLHGCQKQCCHEATPQPHYR